MWSESTCNAHKKVLSSCHSMVQLPVKVTDFCVAMSKAYRLLTR